ncbi:pyridoxamine 5'-phosphate oxidase family protein [Brevundimonas diminuta]|uniref:pyridoxamine 5'-phosphate oxidase family protein n=1 Tax=Brevundimonas diminuta TaxID=293 RepID=UPI0030FABAD7
MNAPTPLSGRASREIIALLGRDRLMTLACIRADGWPQATTVGYVNQGLDLYFKVARDSQKFANLKADPRASIAIRLSGPDCGDGVGVSMAGEAVEVTDPEVATRMEAAVIERFPGVDVYCPSGSSAALLHFRPRLISTVGVAKGRSDPETFILAGAAPGAEAAPAVPGDLQPARTPTPSLDAHGGAPGPGLKRLVALASGATGDTRTMAFAARLAVQWDARVDVVPVYPSAAADMIALGMTLGASLSQTAVGELAAAERELQHRIDTVARTAANDAGARFGDGDDVPRLSVLTRGLRPALAMSRHSALADLVVVAHDSSRDSIMRRHLGEALLAYGAPVLVTRGDPRRLTEPAAIAWDGSPQAGRAVRAALPFLSMASAIHILQCVTGLDMQANDPDTDRLNAYLKLHGIGGGDVVFVEGGNEGAALLAAAEAREAGLLVAGAWGHSRVRETVFGGATQFFLQHDRGPSLLLAH